MGSNPTGATNPPVVKLAKALPSNGRDFVGSNPTWRTTGSPGTNEPRGSCRVKKHCTTIELSVEVNVSSTPRFASVVQWKYTSLVTMGSGFDSPLWLHALVGEQA